jgi:hypothetical protein
MADIKKKKRRRYETLAIIFFAFFTRRSNVLGGGLSDQIVAMCGNQRQNKDQNQAPGHG